MTEQDQILRESYYETLQSMKKLVTVLKPIIDTAGTSKLGMIGTVQLIMPKVNEIVPVITETMEVVEPKLEAHLPLLEAYFDA